MLRVIRRDCLGQSSSWVPVAPPDPSHLGSRAARVWVPLDSEPAPRRRLPKIQSTRPARPHHGGHADPAGTLTRFIAGLAGALGGADQRPAPRAPERPRSRQGVTDLFCPGLTRGQGQHAQKLRSGAARRARAVSHAFLCAYVRRASAHTPAAPARDAARDDVRLDNE